MCLAAWLVAAETKTTTASIAAAEKKDQKENELIKRILKWKLFWFDMNSWLMRAINARSLYTI